jgi:hypothetical protein
MKFITTLRIEQSLTEDRMKIFKQLCETYEEQQVMQTYANVFLEILQDKITNSNEFEYFGDTVIDNEDEHIGLTQKKKEILKSFVGSASSPKLDLNKILEDISEI